MELNNVFIYVFNFTSSFDENFFYIPILIIFSSFVLCFPIPGTLIVILNAILFGIYGIYISYFSSIFAALITYFLMNKIIDKFFVKLNIYKKLLSLISKVFDFATKLFCRLMLIK